MEFEIIDKGVPRVLFIGGPFDGQYLPVPELVEACQLKGLYAPPRLRSDGEPDERTEPEWVEYVRVEKNDTFYYVERELWELSTAQGIDPLP